ncbi:hypothetical protein D3C75_579390 [compost metagenome]
MVLGVQHLVGNALLLQHGRQLLGVLNGDGTDQHRLFVLMPFDDFLHYRTELACFGLVHHVRQILPDHRPVGGHHYNLQAIDLLELFFLGLCRTGHTGQLAVHPEVVLEGDGGQRHAFILDFDAFLGLNRLMQAVAVTAAHHEASGEFIYDDNLFRFVFLIHLHDIIHIALHNGVGLQPLGYMVVNSDIGMVEEVLNVEIALRLGHPCFRQGDGFQLHIHVVILLFPQGHDETVGCHIQIRRLGGLSGNNKRRPRFIHQNGVHFVHNGIIKGPLHHLLFIQNHIVPQVIKAELIVRTIGNITGISSLLVLMAHLCQVQAYCHTEEIIYFAHFVTAHGGQIIIDRYQVDAFAGQCIQIQRQSSCLGFTFTGFHFGNPPAVEHHTTDQLHIKVAFAQHPFGGFPDDSKSIGEDIVQLFPFSHPFLQHFGLRTQLLVGHGLIFRFKGVDDFHVPHHLLDFSLVGVAKNFLYESQHGRTTPFNIHYRWTHIQKL